MSLSDYSDKDLLAEVERRKAAALEAERVAREKRNATIVANIEALLTLVPEHGRISCSDTNPQNPTRCNRCTLLEIKKNSWVSDDTMVEINVNITRGN